MRSCFRSLSYVTAITLVTACGTRTDLLPVGNEGNATCASFDAVAQPAPLDVFLLMDSSGSMEFETEDGFVKWYALRDALSSFFNDPESSGIGVALTFFPQIHPNIPAWCVDENACGDPAACVETRMCFPSGLEYCETDQDCAEMGWPSDTCESVGTCDAQVTELCAPSVGLTCYGGAPCQHLGYCDNRSSCDVADYAVPALPVDALPGAASALVSALNTRSREGGTTTWPAVDGALRAAVTWADTHPSHKVIAVVATDGMPTSCDAALDDDDMALAVEHIAAPASEALARGVQTFVIGVFAPDEQAVASINLDRIADAGGTEAAFVISTGEPVSARFLETLNEIRWSATACEFSLPDAAAPGTSYPRGEVHATAPGNATVDAAYVGNAGCGSDGRGWYYDLDPAQGQTPGRIILCPTTCTEVGADRDDAVEVVVDCPP